MSILQEIVEKNRPELERRKKAFPLPELEALISQMPLRPQFAAVFQTPGIHVIAELKKASPSKGVIWEKLCVSKTAAALEQAGAAALSVLTEPFYFQGALQNLKIASEVTCLPLLRKDFIFDFYQIAEAKLNGASAVLLIAAMLTEHEFASLLEYAHTIGLQVLGEAHSAEELETVRNADLIGVNARDLHNFTTSLELSCELIRQADSGKPVIAESAIRTAEDIKLLHDAGAAGFLIGETLMRSNNPGEKLKGLLKCC